MVVGKSIIKSVCFQIFPDGFRAVSSVLRIFEPEVFVNSKSLDLSLRE